MQHVSMLDQQCPAQSKRSQPAIPEVSAPRPWRDGPSAFKTRSAQRHQTGRRPKPLRAHHRDLSRRTYTELQFSQSVLPVHPRNAASCPATSPATVTPPGVYTQAVSVVTMICDDLIELRVNVDGCVRPGPSSDPSRGSAKWL